MKEEKQPKQQDEVPKQAAIKPVKVFNGAVIGDVFMFPHAPEEKEQCRKKSIVF